MELLKQPLYNPMPLHKQVILLCAASNKLLVDVPAKDMEAVKNGVVEYIAGTYPDIVSQIDTEKKMTDELKDRILAAVKEYKSR